jgi:hypothetical protein
MRPFVPSTPRSPAAPLTVAVCATLTSGFAAAAPIVVDFPDVTLGPGSSYDLTINGSGTLYHFFFDSHGYACVPGPTCTVEENRVDTLTNAIIGRLEPPVPEQTNTFVTALMAGESIDATRMDFITANPGLLSGKDEGSFYGDFVSAPFPETQYAGLRFDLADGTHYGWIEARTDFNEVTLTRFGYESEPGVGTTAGAGVPEPGTLALLALGAAGVAAMRRRSRRH